MALVLNDRVKETTSTTGTGTLTLAGAVTGFETFGAGIGNSNTTYYCLTDGTNFEVGLGTLNSNSTTLARTNIISSSNSDNAVNWSSGTRTIFCTLPASKAVTLDANGNATLGADLSVGDDLTVNGGVIELKNTGAQSELRMYCESANAHYAALKAPAHSDFAGNTTLTLPATTDVIVGRATTDTLTNKTLTSPKINENVAVTATATEINKLDGVTATTTELNYVDVTTLGTVEASKAVTADANGDVLFPDNEKLKLGTGGDLEIFHSSTTSAIIDSGTGDLKIGSDTNLLLTNAGLTETKAKFVTNGASELYHDNVKQFETTSTGASIRADEDDVGLVVGKAHMGHTVHNDFAAFSHFDTRNAEGGYALLQSAVGQTLLNCATGQTIEFRRNNSAIGRFETSGALTVGTGTVITTTNSDTPTTTTSSSDADFVLVDDGGTMKKITPANLGITTGGASLDDATALAIALG